MRETDERTRIGIGKQEVQSGVEASGDAIIIGRQQHPRFEQRTSPGIKAPAFSVPWKGDDFNSAHHSRHERLVLGQNKEGEEEGDAEGGHGRKADYGRSSSSRGGSVAPRISYFDLRSEPAIRTADGSTSPNGFSILALRRTLVPPKGNEVGLGGSIEKEEEEEEDVLGRKVGYHVAGVYVARAAGAAHELPLPPLYHLLEVAHRQRQKELQERSTTRSTAMKEEQGDLRSQQRKHAWCGGTTATNENPTLVELGGSNECGVDRSNRSRSRSSSGTGGDCKNKFNQDVTVVSDGNNVSFNAKNSYRKSDNDNDNGNSYYYYYYNNINENVNHSIENTSSNIRSGNGSGSGSRASTTNTSNATVSNPAAKATACTKGSGQDEGDDMSGLIKGLVASRESLAASRKILERLSKDVDRTRRSLRPESRVDSSVSCSKIGGMTGGTAATAGVAEKTAAVFALAGAEGAGGPVNEGYCGGGDKNDGGCGLSKDTGGARSHGDESTVGGAGEVAALRERAAAAAAAAEAAAKEKQRLKDEIEAIKERLASAEEQLSVSRAAEANGASRVAEAEGISTRLRVQLQAREQQIAELREISQSNLVRAQRRRKQWTS